MSCTHFAFIGFLVLSLCYALVYRLFAAHLRQNLIRRIYHSSHFRQYLLLCMSFILLLSVFMTILMANDNVRMKREYISHWK